MMMSKCEETAIELLTLQWLEFDYEVMSEEELIGWRGFFTY